MKSIYSYIEYRLFLRDWLDQDHQPRGLLSKISEALSCQNSHVTRVLREEVHLTPDQAFLLCQFMKLTDSESHFFMKLVDYERASNINYRNDLKKQLSLLKQEQEDLSKRFKENEITQKENEMVFYSQWLWTAIHSLIAISQYQTEYALSKRLGVDEKTIKEYLEKLLKMGLAQKKNERWIHAGGSIHLSKDSPMVSVHHNNWRLRAVADSQDKNSSGLHYTVTQSLSVKDMDNMKALFLRTIDDYKKIAEPSVSEEVICFNLDFFEI